MKIVLLLDVDEGEIDQKDYEDTEEYEAAVEDARYAMIEGVTSVDVEHGMSETLSNYYSHNGPVTVTALDAREVEPPKDKRTNVRFNLGRYNHSLRQEGV